MRLLILGCVVATVGCTGAPVTETPTLSAPIPESGEERLLRLMQPMKARMLPADFDANYRNVLLSFLYVPMTPVESAKGELALLKSKAWYCSHNVRRGGVVGPPELGEGLEAMKIVGFDESEQPKFQVSRTPWSRFALIDADGDASTLELVRWSDRCEGRDLPFLAIHKMHDLSLAPMLVLTLNPGVATESRTVVEMETDKDGNTVFHVREKYTPNRTGRWRFELKREKRNDVIVEEKIDGGFKEVARFILSDDRSHWTGPGGGASEFWKRIDEPWVGASFFRLSELPSDRWFGGGNHGALRRDADHVKAAREAARDAGLTK